MATTTIAMTRMNRLNAKSITCAELREIIRERDVEIIDVRTPDEFREVRAATARNMPLDTLDPHALMRARTSPPDESLYFICHMGGRSAVACAMFTAAGYPNVVNIEGGTDAWLAAGLPIEQG
jgi:rhodanese-related sulfurtransferase